MTICTLNGDSVPRSSRGRVLLRTGQIWVLLGQKEVFKYTITELFYNSNDRLQVILEPCDEPGCEVQYSESYFRKWFCEASDYIKRRNEVKLKNFSVRRASLDAMTRISTSRKKMGVD